MPFFKVRNDITEMNTDAIVNAANTSLLGGGGVDGAIHRKAGRRLLEECMTLGGCNVGGAKITSGYDLPCRYVIHTVGPIYEDGKHGEREALESCYRESLLLAKKHGCETVAFPLISAGAYGYPVEEAMRVASDTITEFLKDNDMTVYLVIFDKKAYSAGRALFDDITAYIDDNYTRNTEKSETLRRSRLMKGVRAYNAPAKESGTVCAMCSDASLDDALLMLDESFSEMLLRKIDEKGISDVECYKRANIDRKLFSKIRSDKLYRPTKRTAIAFVFALELKLDEAQEMLEKAGFALSHSNKFDIIIEFFIKKGNYDVHEVNEALFEFDQPLLGA